MSASRVSTESCSGCGAELPAHARFCPECGTPADADGATVQQEVPHNETGPVPVSFDRVEPRLFGVTPPALLLAVAVAPARARARPVRRRPLAVRPDRPRRSPRFSSQRSSSSRAAAPYSPVTRASADARERAGSLVETLRARAAAAAEVRRIHSGLAVIEAERRSALLQLGEAAHRCDSLAEAACAPGSRSSTCRRRGSAASSTAGSSMPGRGFARRDSRYRRP